MNLPHSPICAELRSKKYFFLKSAPAESKDVLDATSRVSARSAHPPATPHDT